MGLHSCPPRAARAAQEGLTLPRASWLPSPQGERRREYKPTDNVSNRSEIREDEASYGKRPRGRPRTLDYSVFDPLDVDPMALVQAVLRPPKEKRDE